MGTAVGFIVGSPVVVGTIVGVGLEGIAVRYEGWELGTGVLGAGVCGSFVGCGVGLNVGVSVVGVSVG